MKEKFTTESRVTRVAIALGFAFLGVFNAAAATYYCDPVNGNDANTGMSLSTAFKTFDKGVSVLVAGDTLELRGGTYYESATATIGNTGTSLNPITIKNYGAEIPVIDGGFQQFRVGGNSDWQLYDSNLSIYQSTSANYGTTLLDGFMTGLGSDANSHLVPYNTWADFAATNQNVVSSGGTYIGPGVFVGGPGGGDGHVYVRLQQSQQEQIMGYNIPATANPSNVPMAIFARRLLIRVSGTSAYIIFDGVNFAHGNYIMDVQSGAQHITVENCLIKGGNIHFVVRNSAHDIVFQNITDNYGMPDWIAWSDMKNLTIPGKEFEGGDFVLDQVPYNVWIQDCTLNHPSDAIDATSGCHDIHVINNIVIGNRDDVVQLGTAAYNVEMAYNYVIGGYEGFSRNGDGSTASARPGTIYCHHNVIDVSVKQLGGRNDPNNLLGSKQRGPNGDGMTWSRPFGNHGSTSTSCPWKIYDNTAVFGADLDSQGGGQIGSAGPAYASNPQEVYNNIWEQVGNQWLCRTGTVSDGSLAMDANVYWRTFSSSTPYLESITDGANTQHGANTQNFASLATFKSSQFFIDSKGTYSPGWENSGLQVDPQLDSNYVPHASPVLSGAIDLSRKGWPGAGSETYRGALNPDTTPPVLSLPGNLTIEATGAAGAVVTFTASATDDVDGVVAITLSQASGSLFPLGTTIVNASAHDAAGNIATGSFTVTVQDTTPPVIVTPANITVEATGPNGTVVTFNATASDLVDGVVAVTANPVSGSAFPLGTTTVTLKSTDADHNTATGSFTVTVQDTTSPALTVPADQIVEATSAAGAVANFAAIATDAVGVTSLTYSQNPGTTFSIGTTTVTVTASDAAGNKRTGSFTITVRDSTPPAITSLSASPNLIWPVNKKMVTVTISAVASDTVGVASLKIVSVSTNEPDANTQWQIIDSLTLNLLAGRLGTGTDRIYTITVEARDATGNASTKTVIVTVPHDQGK